MPYAVSAPQHQQVVMLPGVITDGVSSCKDVCNETRIFFSLFSNYKKGGLEVIPIQQIEKGCFLISPRNGITGEGYPFAAAFAFTDNGQKKTPLRKKGGNQAEQDKEKKSSSGKPGADSKEWDGQQDYKSAEFLRLGK